MNTPPDKQLNGISRQFIEESLGASTFHVEEHMQSLWSNQGRIIRLHSDSRLHPTAVLKQITYKQNTEHPRGWNTDNSFARKVRSYEVECAWYENYALSCEPDCKVPTALGIHVQTAQRLILLEDLSEQYPLTCTQLTVDQTRVCLRWLARFHARFMNNKGLGLWEEGCYWHLATRQDEYRNMAHGPIKAAASELDKRLRQARYQTLVHGDAKLANFCFSATMEKAAAVDFQYVGRGCGMRDVAYLLGSCLTEADCTHYEQSLLDGYFEQLNSALEQQMSQIEIAALESEWRALYSIAWTDFYRFLLGWMPSHGKINAYTRALATRALNIL